jgi:hypothetical protein
MKIGHARCCLSPSKSEFYLIGYRSPSRYEPALGIHDDIFGNALLFNDGERESFLFSADYLEFEEAMVEEVKTLLHQKFGICKDLVFLAATHNHSSIVSYHKSWYTKKFDQEYYDFLLETIVNTFVTCRENAQPASAKYGKQVISGFYGNRNHPGKLADNEVIVVKFFNKLGTAFAGFVNWAVHSTIISPSNRYLTSDWAGSVSKELEKEFGFFPAMIVGAAGDSSNRNERQGKGFEELIRVTEGMASAISKITVHDELSLTKGIVVKTFAHRIHYNPYEMNEQNKEAIANYKIELATTTDKEDRAFINKEIEKLSEHLELTNVDILLKASVVMLGCLQIFVFPGELGSKFGRELKSSAPGLGIVLGYTNGYYGYFLPDSEYGLSFETIGTLIPIGESEKIIKEFKDALATLVTIEEFKSGVDKLNISRTRRSDHK